MLPLLMLWRLLMLSLATSVGGSRHDGNGHWLPHLKVRLTASVPSPAYDVGLLLLLVDAAAVSGRCRMRIPCKQKITRSVQLRMDVSPFLVCFA